MTGGLLHRIVEQECLFGFVGFAGLEFGLGIDAFRGLRFRQTLLLFSHHHVALL